MLTTVFNTIIAVHGNKKGMFKMTLKLENFKEIDILNNEEKNPLFFKPKNDWKNSYITIVREGKDDLIIKIDNTVNEEIVSIN
jgi:hypothetical protein